MAHSLPGMIKQQIEARGITDPKILKAFSEVSREYFLPEDVKHLAYYDGAVPIGYDQTISQPYVVAYMTDALKLKEDDRVLEIGTGSGYQTAILAKLVKSVYTVEIVKELSKRAQKILSELKLDQNVHFKIGDGYQGFSEGAPYDAIILTAAPPDQVPGTLFDQLKDNGRLLAPVGSISQNLILYTKTKNRITQEILLPVTFVPMVRGDTYV